MVETFIEEIKIFLKLKKIVNLDYSSIVPKLQWIFFIFFNSGGHCVK